MKKKLKQLFRTAYQWLAILGFDPLKTIPTMRELIYYYRDLQTIKKQRATAAMEFSLGPLKPCLFERHSESGSASGHYFHQDILVARRIFHHNPTTHLDIGSRIDGFVAHVSVFRPIIVIDIRPQSNKIANIKFIQADIMAPLREDLIECCDSLSCLHAMEHFGLGRYGDPVNYDGYLIGLKQAYKILKAGGKFYFSIPIGPQRIEFNAHRVFSVSFLLECFRGKYNIDQFSFVDDRGDLHENILLEDVDVQNNFDCRYGCGIFEMTKK